ncbi:MAG: ATP-dependent RecD-like DNA helicase [Planctomycetota bacterium]
MEARLFSKPPLDETEIEGVCEKIHYESSDSRYRILSIRLVDQRLVSVTGQFGPIHEGERLKVWGNYVEHILYGWRFESKQFQLLLPQSAQEVERFLASGFIPGIGKKMAKILVEHHGAEVLRLMSEHPEKLKEIPGIGEKRLESILKSWKEKTEDREFEILLRGWGLTPRMIQEVKEKIGQEGIPEIKENPYLLAQQISGLHFRRADTIAQILGIPPDSKKRIVSSARFFLEKALDEGHCYLPFNRLCEKLVHYLDISMEVLAPLLQSVLDDHELICLSALDQPCYLPRFYQLEQFIAKRLQEQSVPIEHPISLVRLQEALSSLSHLSSEQQQIVTQMANQRFAILTGGPGVGKTTVLKALYQIFDRERLRVCLAAPTGRAAKRMEMATSVPTQTIHRLLKIRPEEILIEKLQTQERILADVVILDECSMLDVELFSLLLSGLSRKTRLYLVGDADQLPSVGAGNVLTDLLKSERFPAFRLTQIFRQKKESSIVLNAHRILSGQEIFSDTSTSGEFYIIKQRSPEKTLEMLLEMLIDRIPRQFSLKPDQIQILCPMRKGKLGTNALNEAIQKTFQKSELLHQFCLGDKVMQIKNNYDKEIFNGDIGTVQELQNAYVRIAFKNRLVEYSVKDLDELQLAYAISIHKSQGSEFPGVIIPFSMEQFAMLQQNLLYTAVTRGKNLVILIGDPSAIQRALHNKERQARYTHLETWIREQPLH